MDTTTITPTDLPTTTEAPVSDAPVESNPIGHGNDEHGKPATPGEGHTPVTLCHNGHTIVVDDDAVPGHMEHHADDYLGECTLPVVEPVRDETPTILCHDGDTITLPAWEATEHFTLGDVAGVCGPEWHPVTEPVAPPKVETPVVTVPKAEVPIVDEASNPVGLLTETTGPDDMWWACTYEDGSQPGQQFPCLWDAAHMGNGEGVSFVLDEAGGTPHYVTDVSADGTTYTSDVLPVAAPVTTEAGVSVAVESNPIGLAETGMNATAGCGIALALLVIGVGLVRGARKAARRG